MLCKVIYMNGGDTGCKAIPAVLPVKNLSTQTGKLHWLAAYAKQIKCRTFRRAVLALIVLQEPRKARKVYNSVTPIYKGDI